VEARRQTNPGETVASRVLFLWARRSRFIGRPPACRTGPRPGSGRIPTVQRLTPPSLSPSRRLAPREPFGDIPGLPAPSLSGARPAGSVASASAPASHEIGDLQRRTRGGPEPCATVAAPLPQSPNGATIGSAEVLLVLVRRRRDAGDFGGTRTAMRATARSACRSARTGPGEPPWKAG
jgi:hypothetical protein